MMFSVDNTPDGYVVKAYIYLSNEDGLRWMPLRNFGDRQGDAIEFRDYDCPKLNDWQLKCLIKQYDKNTKYIRLSSTKFIKQH